MVGAEGWGGSGTCVYGGIHLMPFFCDIPPYGKQIHEDKDAGAEKQQTAE